MKTSNKPMEKMNTFITIQAIHKHLKSIDLDVYTGKVTVYEGGKYLWSKFSPNTRLTASDALDDATGMRQDILETAIWS